MPAEQIVSHQLNSYNVAQLQYALSVQTNSLINRIDSLFSPQPF